MIIAWALQTRDSESEVESLVTRLFGKDLLKWLDSILDWAYSGIIFNYVECFEDETDGEKWISSNKDQRRG